MMHQGLPPGVEHRKEPDLSAQMAGIRRDGPQRLGDRPEEEAIDDGLVLVGDGGDRRGDREDDVEVVDGEQVRSAGVDPRGACQGLARRAMAITTRVVPDPLMPALVTLLDVATQGGSPARLDRGHDASLGRRE